MAFPVIEPRSFVSFHTSLGLIDSHILNSEHQISIETRQTMKLQFLLALMSATALEVFSFTFQHLQTNSIRSMKEAKRNEATRLYGWDGEDDDDDFDYSPSSINVLGTPMIPCCTNVGNSGIGTGFYRNGYCSTGDTDVGRHTVCVQVNDDFLNYSEEAGNDLRTPNEEYMFPGLTDGDVWCLCAQRWAQAFNAGRAPKIFLKSTHEKTLDYVTLDLLMSYAIDRKESQETLDQLNEERAKLDRLF